MSITKAILHIGAGKCGSSALQEYLSKSTELRDRQNRKVLYGTLLPSGEISTGEKVTDQALLSVFQYASSTTLRNLQATYSPAKSVESLDGIDADTLILSCESWINDPEIADELLTWLNHCEVKVVAYVRPPVLWLNSAWWQWGAWSKADFDYWIDIHEPMSYWSSYIKRWENVSFVNNIRVRLLSGDIVSDFLDLNGLQKCTAGNPQQSSLSNVSLPGPVLRIYQKYPELRPSPHESTIDFSLSRHLNKITQSPDWVISNDKIQKIIENTKSYNEELKDYIDASQIDIFINDTHWWSSDAYRKPADIPSMREITEEETRDIVVHSFRSLHRAEQEIIILKNKLRKAGV